MIEFRTGSPALAPFEAKMKSGKKGPLRSPVFPDVVRSILYINSTS